MGVPWFWSKCRWCEFATLPAVRGFPNLKRLELVECSFSGEDHAVMRSLGVHPAPPIEHLVVEGCAGVDVSPIAGLTRLRTLTMHECRDQYPDLDEAASEVMKGKLLRGEVNADGRGCLCAVIMRRLNVRRAERALLGLVQCDRECCGPCDCGECSDCE